MSPSLLAATRRWFLWSLSLPCRSKLTNFAGVLKVISTFLEGKIPEHSGCSLLRTCPRTAHSAEPDRVGYTQSCSGEAPLPHPSMSATAQSSHLAGWSFFPATSFPWLLSCVAFFLEMLAEVQLLHVPSSNCIYNPWWYFQIIGVEVVICIHPTLTSVGSSCIVSSIFNWHIILASGAKKYKQLKFPNRFMLKRISHVNRTEQETWLMWT